MKASEIFHKTANGQSEVEARSDRLSMKERRVLILVNGEKDTATLKQLSSCENIAEILQSLLDGGFIAQNGDTLTLSEFDPATDPTEVDPTEVDPTEIDPTEVDPTEVDPTEVDPTEVDSTEVDSTEVDSTEVDSTEVDSTEVDSTEIDSTEIDNN